MTAETPIDQAHAAMQAAPEDAALRLQFYDRIAQSELFLLLCAEPGNSDQIDPDILKQDGLQYLLAFDREDRMVEFAQREVPFVAVSGRVIAQMLDGQGLGIALNLGGAPSSILLPPEAMVWLNQTLDHAPQEIEARPTELLVPKGLPEQLITTLDARLATAMGLARCAYLVGVRYDTGAQGHMLGFVGAIPQAQGALTQLASEALTFSGIEAGAMDVAFVSSSDPVVPRLERVGLRFDLPQPESAANERPAPGSDPAKPPVLR